MRNNFSLHSPKTVQGYSKPWTALIAAVVCLSTSTGAIGQQLHVAPIVSKQKLVSELTVDITNRLASLGYKDIKLSAGDKSIAGSAVKDGRRVEVLFDQKGQLHVQP